jgi:hypothetical protein
VSPSSILILQAKMSDLNSLEYLKQTNALARKKMIIDYITRCDNSQLFFRTNDIFVEMEKECVVEQLKGEIVAIERAIQNTGESMTK